MTRPEGATDRPSERIPTGVPGLDTILHGGFLRGGVYMLQGHPGAGKTILANQLCFHHASQGGRVVYATLLAESHERMIFNLEPLTFFDASLIPEKLTYVSAFSVLQERGLTGLVEMLRREARTRKATLLVVDGLVGAEESASTRQEFKKMIHELQTHAGLVGCTVILLTSGSSSSPMAAEHTMVDGFIELGNQRVGRRAERELEIRKFRGSSIIRGGHSFQITDAGLVVHPRLEAMLQEPSQKDPCKLERVSTGIPRLNEMLHGGLPCGSSTIVFGPSGVGKTTLGLHFLNHSGREEPGLHVGFYETPDRVLLKSKTLGLDLKKRRDEGSLGIQWYPPTERILDAVGNKLLDEVRARGVKRLFVDGVEGFIKTATYPDRVSHFFAALTNELRVLGVTTIFSSELQEMFAQKIKLPTVGVSSLAENVILLRFVELRAQLHRLLSIMKVRDSDYDGALREFRITPHGVDLEDTFKSSEAILSGLAREVRHPSDGDLGR